MDRNPYNKIKIQKKMLKIEKIKKYYVNTAIILLNLIVLFIILNTFLYFANPIFRQLFVPGALTYNDETLDEIYPGMSSHDEARTLIKETNQDIFHVYEPFTGFKVGAFKGKYINIDEKGFRHIENQCKYPINNSNYNIFVIGGSTTFGTGVADKDTIASRIQNKLRERTLNNNICVYNFGRPFYYSTQDRELFISKIVDNEEKPNAAIFIDGLNEHALEIENNKRLSDLMAKRGRLGYLIAGTPITRVTNHLSNRFIKNFTIALMEPDVNRIFNRYLENKKIISSVAKEYNISAYFTIQPVPMYNYNYSNHFMIKRNLMGDFDQNQRLKQSKLFYMMMNETGKKDEVIWLADMQMDKNENLYVDYGHYNARFSDEIAENIVNHILKDNKSVVYSEKEN